MYKCYGFLHNAVNKKQNELYKRARLQREVGYANGYVAVPPEHPLFGSYYDYPEICIHGGLTYSRLSENVFETFDMSAIEILDGDIPKGYWVFGFDCDYRCKRVIKASDEIHAIRRYFKWYYRYYKETSEHQTYYPEPCSRRWAHVAVEDSKGYKHFYR